jgi:hypothetical protein
MVSSFLSSTSASASIPTRSHFIHRSIEASFHEQVYLSASDNLAVTIQSPSCRLLAGRASPRSSWRRHLQSAALRSASHSASTTRAVATMMSMAPRIRPLRSSRNFRARLLRPLANGSSLRPGRLFERHSASLPQLLCDPEWKQLPMYRRCRCPRQRQSDIDLVSDTGLCHRTRLTDTSKRHQVQQRRLYYGSLYHHAIFWWQRSPVLLAAGV